MNRKLRQAKSAQRLKDKQINFMLEGMEKDIENLMLVISEKDKQLRDLKKILFAAKASYKKVTEENQQLKQRIALIKENKKLRQQQATIEEHKNFYYPKQPTRPKRYKKIVYEEETDSDSNPEKEKETYTLPEVEPEEEEKETIEQNSRLEEQYQRPQQQKLPQKRRIKIFGYLNSKNTNIFTL